MGRRKRVAEDLPINREEQEEWQPTGPCRFQQLPQALVIDILSRLLVKPLLNCRCVCKSWLSIISDPQFSFVHLPKSPIGILINTNPEKRTSRIIDYTQIEESADSQFHLEKMRFSTKNSLPPLSCFELINSCNGLLLLAEVGPNIDGPFPLYVCNPILGEFIALPLANEGRLYCSFIGLGCSAVTKEYKVLQTCGDYRKDEDGARIYTIGTGVWKSIGKTPQDFAQFAPFNAVLHGALHWLASSGRTLELINAFHFETEEFRTLPPPGSFTPFQKQFKDCLKLGVFDGCLFICVYGYDSSKFDMKLGVFDGCLFICVYGYDSSKFDMWVMKEYGVQESWRKTLVVEGLYPRQLDNDVYEPLVFLRNGEILLSYIDWTVVCYNQEKNASEGN
uniref:F-box protein At3g07870-like isoform X1 n=1 Tax=Fragaria vesca subsp. vesca TaxID=101020 RepID=UPI0005C9E24B|nr:PREDICTED: F-box protein At3g07870-like isoform X1 [Fragaria vesca subsp. vesca]